MSVVGLFILFLSQFKMVLWNEFPKLGAFSKLNVGKGLFIKRMGHVWRVTRESTTSKLGALTEMFTYRPRQPSEFSADLY